MQHFRKSMHGKLLILIPFFSFIVVVPFQNSLPFHEESHVNTRHQYCVWSNSDVARAGFRKHGGQHGVPESDCGVHSD